MLPRHARKQRKVYHCVNCQAAYLHDDAYMHALTCPKRTLEPEKVE